MSDLYDDIEKWYTQKGISVMYFFSNNSTEYARELMIEDFSYRALSEITALKEELKRTKDSLFSYKRANEEIREELKREREVTDFLNQLLEDEHEPTEEDIDKLWPIVIEVKKQRKIEL